MTRLHLGLWFIATAALTSACGIMISCGATSRTVEHNALSDVVDCTTPDRVRLEAQFGPTMEQALQRALGMDGKIDLPSLQQITGSLEADGWCVAEKSAARLIGWVAGKLGQPAAAEQPLDAQDLTNKLSALRASKFGTTQFKLGPAT